MPSSSAHNQDRFMVRFQSERRDVLGVGDKPTPANRWRGWNGDAVRLIIEGDVSGDDGEIEHAASLSHPFNAGGKLGHDFRALRITEVHAIGKRERLRARGREISPSLRDCLLAAFKWVCGAIPRSYVACQRKGFVRPVNPDHGGVGTGPYDGVAHDHMVVLLPDPAS